MRRFVMLLILIVSAGGLALWGGTKADSKIKREPLQKAGAALKAPAVYEKRTRIESGQSVTYDPKPRVQVVDEKAGKYEFRWIGYDGQEKVIAYQRPDAIDVVVTGSVENSADGNYTYTYVIDILPSSATYLYSFDLQNFADDTRPVEINSQPTTLADLRLLKTFRQMADDGKPKKFENTLLIGEMSSAIQRYKDGNWIAFGTLPDFEPDVAPGRKLRLKLVSRAAPGLVECTATGGSRTMKGVGEHMPSELEEVLPGYDALPFGNTVGPVTSLNSLSQSQRIDYFLERMVQFEKLGWITPAARAWYEKNLRGNLLSAQRQAREDFTSEQMSSEVFAMIEAIK